MTTKSFKCGSYSCKAYKKAVGRGYEVGFVMAGHPIFVGNFIHAKEATAWWVKLNAEVKKFSKKYAFGPKTPFAWYSKFMSNYIYKCYYNYLDQQFSKYNKGYTFAVKKDERKWGNYKKAWSRDMHHHTVRRAA